MLANIYLFPFQSLSIHTLGMRWSLPSSDSHFILQKTDEWKHISPGMSCDILEIRRELGVGIHTHRKYMFCITLTPFPNSSSFSTVLLPVEECNIYDHLSMNTMLMMMMMRWWNCNDQENKQKHKKFNTDHVSTTTTTSNNNEYWNDERFIELAQCGSDHEVVL